MGDAVTLLTIRSRYPVPRLFDFQTFQKPKTIFLGQLVTPHHGLEYMGNVVALLTYWFWGGMKLLLSSLTQRNKALCRRHHASGGLPVPEQRRLGLGFIGHGRGGLALDIVRCAQPVGPLGDSNRPLGVGPKRQAWNAKIGRLLLDTTRAGDGRRQLNTRFMNGM